MLRLLEDGGDEFGVRRGTLLASFIRAVATYPRYSVHSYTLMGLRLRRRMETLVDLRKYGGEYGYH